MVQKLYKGYIWTLIGFRYIIMKFINCNPTKKGIFLRLLFSFIFILYGVLNTNYIVLFIGCIPIIRLVLYFIEKRKSS